MSNIVTKLSYGVYVVSALDGARPTGCIANCAMQITAEPPTFAISINHDNFTHRCIKETGKFAVSVLAQDSDPAIIRTFGFKSGADTNKFDSVGYVDRGVPVVKDSCGFIVCRVINTMETATHTVFLGELVESDVFDERSPMTYDYYHKVIKGSAPKKAPTYVPPSAKSAPPPKKMRKFVCSVCDYEYEGEELPSDFVCPICGVGADMFTEVDS